MYIHCDFRIQNQSYAQVQHLKHHLAVTQGAFGSGQLKGEGWVGFLDPCSWKVRVAGSTHIGQGALVLA